MTLAFTISSYRLHDFVQLGLKQLRLLSPGSPILVSDDASPDSKRIEELAKEHRAEYRCSRIRRGHFANDMQSLIYALAFARDVAADVAVKISQRFIFRRPEAVSVIQKAFEDPNIVVATPGRPTVQAGANRATKGFSAFSMLSDVVMLRVGCMKPEELLYLYRDRLIRERGIPWASFIECAVDALHSSKFPGKTVKIPELTDPTDDPIYLRRYQASEQQYRDLAATHGLNGSYRLGEWSEIEGQNYLCRPVVA